MDVDGLSLLQQLFSSPAEALPWLALCLTAGSATAARSILLAEDNAIASRAVWHVLSGEGYAVTTAADGVQALALARAAPPDLIITDILMPEMDGFALCREVKADARLQHIPVIFYSATFTSAEDRVLADAVGAARFLVKSTDHDILLRHVAQLLEHPRAVPGGAGAPPVPAVTRLYEARLVAKLNKKVAELEASEEKFRHVVEMVPDVLFVLSAPDFTLTFVSPALTTLLGYTPEEFVGSRDMWRDHMEADDLPAVLEVLDEVVRNCAAARLEARFRPRNGGASIWFEGRLTPQCDEAGEVNSIFGVMTDITARKLAEVAAQEKQRELATLMGNLPGMVYRCLNDGRWTMQFVSDGCLALTGYRAEELVGNATVAYADLIHPDDRDAVWDEVQAALAERRQYRLNYRLRTAAGGERWVWELGSGVWQHGDRLEALEGFVSDITQQRLAEEEIHRLARFPAENPNPVLRIGLDGTLMYANAASSDFLRQMDCAPGQVLGGELLDSARLALEDNASRVVEFALGEHFYSFVVAPLADDGYVNLYGKEVTERVRAVSALRASENRYRHLFAMMLDGLAVHEIITDADDHPVDYRFLEVNDAFEKLTGLTRDAAVGHTVRELLPDIEQQWIDIYGAVALGDGPARFEQYAGTLGRYFEVVAFSPQPRQFVTVFSDVTEQRVSERTLYRLNRALRTLSHGNEALVRARNEQELLENVCRAVGEQGEYPVAWVGYLGTGGTMELVAAWGLNDTGRDALQGQGDAVHACVHLRELQAQGEAVVLKDGDVAHARCGVWEAGRSHGAQSAVLLPLLTGGFVNGVLAIYSSLPEAFDSDELKLLQELAGDLGYGIDALRIRESHRQRGERLQRALLETIRSIALTIEKRDPYTAGHQQRVAALAAAIAAEMGLETEHVEGIRMGSLVHDIGKIYVPSEILNRPGRLSAVEFGIIKTHPEVGYDIIRNVEFPWPVGEMILQHHERLDGSGYPRGLRGEEIILEARILAVADVVEAMASHRPYRPGLGLERALQEIEAGRGKAYDPRVVESCLRLFRDKGFQLEL